MDKIKYWRPFIEKAETLCKEAGGWLSWKTKYDDLCFMPNDVDSEVIHRVWELEDIANNINPETGAPR